MKKIGVSLHIETILGTTGDDVQAYFLREFTGARAMLAYLRERGVSYIELRDMRRLMPVEYTRRAVLEVHRAGMAVTLHSEFEETGGGDYLERVSQVVSAAFTGQNELLFNVHPLPDNERSYEKYGEWCSAFAACDNRLRLVIENMRVTKPGTEHYRLAGVAGIAAGGDARCRGLCWDMGHYAYNVMTAGLPPETLPVQEIARAVTHTHIHSLYTPWMDTHHPLKPAGEPALAYIAALMSSGYGGIYNIEMDFRRYNKLVSPRDGLCASLEILQEILNDKKELHAL